MEDRSPAALAVVNADGIGLQVQFRWMKDRHSHTINLLFENRTIPVLESLEGTDVEPWPESPPLQQLSIEELRPSTRAALLVGMAGQSHWSMSVEPNPAEMEFQFDVACRLRGCRTSGHCLSVTFRREC